MVDSEAYFLVCARCIELNPVRAGMVRDPLVREHALYESLGATRRDRCAAYAQMFAGEIDESTIGLIRNSTNKGLALGDERFRTRVETVARRQAAPWKKGRPPNDKIVSDPIYKRV